MNITNIHTAEWTQEETRLGTWKYVPLPFEKIGVRVESLDPGAKSSFHHYHTLEEEHLLVLEGTATLYMDSGEHALEAGDHVFFPAGSKDAHHIRNTSNEDFKFFVFGERIEQDVVFYPRHGKKLIKSPELKTVDMDEEDLRKTDLNRAD